MSKKGFGKKPVPSQNPNAENSSNNDGVRFDFGQAMQEDVLRLMAKDSDFTEASANWIKPEYFDTEEKTWVAEKIIHFHENYAVAPTKSEIEHLLQKEITQKKITSKTKRELIEGAISSAYDDILSGSRGYTVEQVREFAQAQAWNNAILAALPYLQVGNHKKVEELMREASESVVDLDQSGLWYFEQAHERISRRLNSDLLDESSFIIPTGIMEIDLNLRRGGFGPGEAVVWMAPKGGGKSIALGHVTRRAIIEGAKVAYFSFEMDDHQNADRMDAGFSGVSMWDLEDPVHSERVREKLTELGVRFPRSLYIKRYPTKGATIADLHRNLKSLQRTHKWVPDMIVLDYMTIVKPGRKRDKREVEIAEISEDFRWLLGEWKVPGHTAAQINRAGAKRKTAEGTEAAGSWDALATFDAIFIINQTKEERRDKILRIFFDKLREGTDKIEVGPLDTDWERMCFARRSLLSPEEILGNLVE